MSTPKVEENRAAGIYLFRYHQEGMTIRVDRLTEDKKSLWAELYIEGPPERLSSVGTHSPRRLQSLVGRDEKAALHAPSGTGSLRAHQVGRGYRTGLPGGIQRHRKGEPAVLIGDVVIPESLSLETRASAGREVPNPYLWIWRHGQVLPAAFLATLVSEGYIWEGHDVEPGRVLYLDYESTKFDSARRMLAIHRGLDIGDNKSKVLYRRCSKRLASEVHDVQRLVLEHACN